MSNVVSGKFANAEMVSRIRADVLLAWLLPRRVYFEGRGVRLVPQVDCAKLAEVLRDPTPDMPLELLEALYAFRGLDSEAGMDALMEEAKRRGLDLGLGPDATPLDVVVRAWSRDRQLVELVRARHAVRRGRSFQYFTTDANPVPEFTGPTADQLRLIEEGLEPFYVATSRGPGARVFAWPDRNRWRFVVQHGRVCKCEEAMDNGQPTSVFFRPRHRDVLVLDPARGEIGVNSCNDAERRVLLRKFGRCLFGRPDFFPGTDKYTVFPILRDGRDCLACGDVPGIEGVKLTRVEFCRREEERHRTVQEGDDIFGLVERGRVKWPERLEDITSATFQVRFRGARRPRRLTIMPCNRVIYGREEDWPLLERLMLARGFIKN
jgi:hypothetical protein